MTAKMTTTTTWTWRTWSSRPSRRQPLPSRQSERGSFAIAVLNPRAPTQALRRRRGQGDSQGRPATASSASQEGQVVVVGVEFRIALQSTPRPANRLTPSTLRRRRKRKRRRKLAGRHSGAKRPSKLWAGMSCLLLIVNHDQENCGGGARGGAARQEACGEQEAERQRQRHAVQGWSGLVVKAG